MNERAPLSKFDQPETGAEGYYEQSEFFDYVRGIQRELDLKRFDSYIEANEAAQDLIHELDAAVREEGMMGRIATLVGPHVAMPTTYYAAHGGIELKMEQAYDDAGKLKDVTGAFNGMCCLAIGEPWSGRYRPVLGFSVRLRPIFTPGFDGTLTAYGPVDSTFVDFLDDEIKRELP